METNTNITKIVIFVCSLCTKIVSRNVLQRLFTVSTLQSLYFITLTTFTTLLSICTKIKKCADNDEEDFGSPRINKKFIDQESFATCKFLQFIHK